MIRRMSFAAGCLMLCVVFAGCAETKLTRQNYDMIMKGQSTRDEVRLTLGDPAHDLGDSWQYEDMDRYLSVAIHFDKNGKVIQKEWRDGEANTWEGAAPEIDENPEGETFNESRSGMTVDKQN